jgi:hypothetical protein
MGVSKHPSRKGARHTGNTLAAQSGPSLRDLMTRMGHDSPAAALIYQHSGRASDEAIAAAVDTRLAGRLQGTERESGNGAGARLGPKRRPGKRAMPTKCVG